ncbi:MULTISPECIES: transposase [Streptomyces]|uniref:transposase n=1 Tax=Streptomyces TaxID=1883 RepID=UPI002F266EB7
MRTLVGLAPAPEHRRGHGTRYGGLNQGQIDVARLRRALEVTPLPRASGGRIVLAADVSPWLRPAASTCPDRAFRHTFGRGEGKHRLAPGGPCSIVAALETGRTSWTAVLDAARLESGADVAADGGSETRAPRPALRPAHRNPQRPYQEGSLVRGTAVRPPVATWAASSRAARHTAASPIT